MNHGWIDGTVTLENDKILNFISKKYFDWSQTENYYKTGISQRLIPFILPLLSAIIVQFLNKQTLEPQPHPVYKYSENQKKHSLS